jgi:hypothetical protein
MKRAILWSVLSILSFQTFATPTGVVVQINATRDQGQIQRHADNTIINWNDPNLPPDIFVGHLVSYDEQAPNQGTNLHKLSDEKNGVVVQTPDPNFDLIYLVEPRDPLAGFAFELNKQDYPYIPNAGFCKFRIATFGVPNPEQFVPVLVNLQFAGSSIDQNQNGNINQNGNKQQPAVTVVNDGAELNGNIVQDGGVVIITQGGVVNGWVNILPEDANPADRTDYFMLIGNQGSHVDKITIVDDGLRSEIFSGIHDMTGDVFELITLPPVVPVDPKPEKDEIILTWDQYHVGGIESSIHVFVSESDRNVKVKLKESKTDSFKIVVDYDPIYILPGGTDKSFTGEIIIEDSEVDGPTKFITIEELINEDDAGTWTMIPSSEIKIEIKNSDLQEVVNNMTQEKCDGVDNDCEGIIDNDVSPDCMCVKSYSNPVHTYAINSNYQEYKQEVRLYTFTTNHSNLTGSSKKELKLEDIYVGESVILQGEANVEIKNSNMDVLFGSGLATTDIDNVEVRGGHLKIFGSGNVTVTNNDVAKNIILQNNDQCFESGNSAKKIVGCKTKNSKKWDGPTGKLEHVSPYPNPTTGLTYFRIVLNETAHATLTVRDVLGRVVAQAHVNGQQLLALDLEGLSGMLHYQLSDGHTIYLQGKLMIH